MAWLAYRYRQTEPPFRPFVRAVDLERSPCMAVMAGGLAGVGQQYEILDEPPAGAVVTTLESTNRRAIRAEKPPYRVPLLSEIREIPWNGLTVISAFAGAGGSSTGYRMAGCRVLAAVEFVPAAGDSYEANMADHTKLLRRDVRSVTAEELLEAAGLEVGQLDIFDGSPPCFPAGTLVVTGRGEVPIEDVREGDLALTHEGRYRRVTEAMVRPYAGRLVEVDVKYRPAPVRCTAEHPILARRRVVRTPRQFAEPEWIAAADLRPGDMVLAPAVRQPGLAPPCLEVDERRGHHPRCADGATASITRRACRVDLARPEVAYALGLYLAEGHRRGIAPSAGSSGPGRREVVLSVATAEAEGVAHSLTAAGLRPKIQAHTQSCLRVTVTSMDWWASCGTMGDGAHRKAIPEWAHGMPQRWREQLLAGYLAGDGYGRGVTRGANTASEVLARSLARLVQETVGIAASIGRIRRAGPTTIQEREVVQRDLWRVRWTSPTPTGDVRRAALVDEWGAWLPVRAVGFGAPAPAVFNLEVEGDHSYVAGGLAAHNCEPFSSAGQRDKTWRQVREYSGQHQRTDDLFYEYIRLVDGLRPRAFVAENVTGLIRGRAKGYFKFIIARMRELGYVVEAKVLDASWLGVPQSRRRVIFQGIREDLGRSPAWPSPLPYQYTVRDALPHIARVGTDPNFDRRRREKLTVDEMMVDAGRPASTVQCGPAGTKTPGASGANGYVQDVAVEHSKYDMEPEDVTDEPAPCVMSMDSGHWKVVGMYHDTGGQFGDPDRNRLDEPAPTVTNGGSNRRGGGAANCSHYQVEEELVEDGRVVFRRDTRGQFGGDKERDRMDEPAPTVTAGRPADFQLEEVYDQQVVGNEAFEPEFGSLDRPHTTVMAGGARTSGELRASSTGRRRQFTIPELIRICGFPDDYVLTGSFAQRWERLGDSVPPPMAAAWARALAEGPLAPRRRRSPQAPSARRPKRSGSTGSG